MIRELKSIYMHLCLIILGLQLHVFVTAQDTTFKASAPSVVQVGRAFNYTISGDKQGSVELPDLKGIRIVGGPGTSVSTRSTNVNGRLQTVTEVRYNYMFMINEEGDYEIPPATIRSEGKEYFSNSLSIKAIKAAAQARSTSPESPESSENVMVRLESSRENVYVGEQFIVEIKVYVRENLRVNALDEPAYEGFWREELEADNFVNTETVNGLGYRTQVIKRVLLTAQKAGELSISPAQMDVLIRKRVGTGRSSDIFDEFFNDPFFSDPFERYESVQESYTSNSLKIHVKALPQGAPPSFNGAVGNFSISAGISRDSIGADESLTLNIQMEGRGNLSLLQAPEVDFPPGLEVFDPKVSTDLKHDKSGTSGKVRFEYLIIPRSKGNFRIAPVEYSWFDPAASAYKNYRSKEFYFSVSGEMAEEGGALSEPGFFREEVRDIDSDIRYIKTDPGNLRPKSGKIIRSGWMLIYPSGFVVLFIFLLLSRQNRRRKADADYVRNKRAAKVAGKRLRIARNLMNADNEGFYEEILKACWGYLSDKFGVNMSELSREKIRQKLAERDMPDDLRDELFYILDECEYSRYSPGERSDKNSIYHRAEKCLSAIEQKI